MVKCIAGPSQTCLVHSLWMVEFNHGCQGDLCLEMAHFRPFLHKWRNIRTVSHLGFKCFYGESRFTPSESVNEHQVFESLEVTSSG